MAITPYLNGERFDPETRRVLGIALELACIALRVGECDEGVRQAIAAKLIGLARTGERNPDLLCEQALKDIRTPQLRTARPRRRQVKIARSDLQRRRRDFPLTFGNEVLSRVAD